ncbi:hypothetical protein Hamer_G011970 [Homarus americanus]|uniref:Uncharacterized protein n=1 Tax=Homarus americanus TaxID=6706 RepID=A0A8J5K3P7_HOMAM|nr:hypothetical protein Hamer_G011970 [Homarus americanus]
MPTDHRVLCRPAQGGRFRGCENPEPTRGFHQI